MSEDACEEFVSVIVIFVGDFLVMSALSDKFIIWSTDDATLNEFSSIQLSIKAILSFPSSS